jgi:non-ribosomal peptide synthetase component F/MFS family permease
MTDTARRIAALSPEQRERLMQELARARRESPAVAAAAPQAPPAATETTLPPLVARPGERWQPFPLTVVQQMYWAGRSRLFDLWTPGGNVYIEYELTGDLDGIADAVEAAMAKIIEHHEILRFTVLPDGRGQLLERVPRFYVDVESLAGLPPAEVERRLAAARERYRYQEGPAGTWPLFGILLNRLDGSRMRAHIWFDCLLVDGLSRDNFWRDLFQVIRQPSRSLTPLPFTYRDYAVAWEEIRKGPAYEQAREHWQERIAALPPPLDLPLAEPLSPETRSRFTEVFGPVLSADAWKRLQEKAGRLGCTPSSLLLAAFIEALRTWSARPRFFFSVEGSHWPPIHPRIREIVGNFNTVYIVAADDLAGSFADRARRLHAQISWILENRVFSGFEVLREVRRKLGGGTRALSPVMFNSLVEFRHASYQDLRRPVELSESAPAEEAPVEASTRLQTLEEAAFMPQLLLLPAMIQAEDGTLFCKQMSQEQAFAPGVPRALRHAFATLLGRLAEDDRAWEASHFSLAPASQLASRPAWTAPPPLETTLHALFSTQAELRREAAAVAWADGRLTYAELAARARSVALRLQALGAGPGETVAVVLDGSWRQAAAVLGALGSGAACLPLDGSLPPESRAETLRRHGVRFALGPGESGESEGLYWLAVEGKAPAPAPDRSVPAPAPHETAYRLPGGTEVEHRAAATAFLDLNLRLDLMPEDRVLALSPPGSDFALYEMLGPLAAGATVVLPSGGEATVWSGPPALLEQALARREAGELPAPRLVLASRDTLPLSLPERLRAAAPGVRVLAGTGLPEAPPVFALHEVDRVPPGALSHPAGRPVAGFTLHVLDHALEPRPDWVPGERFVGGPCLASGPSSRFLVHPRTGERLLRTGLAARFLPGGLLEVLGREGEWAASRFGYPVELRRIEAALERHPDVRAAVARFGPGRDLHAWAVPAPRATVEAADLAAHLAARLPPYMVPASLETLPEAPLDGTGALDREALFPKPDDPRPTGPAFPVPPADPLEEELARDWCEILGVDSVSVTESFFEAGGDSFRAVLLLDRLRERFDDPGDLAAFFYDPTIRSLAERLRGKERKGSAAAHPSVFKRLAGLLRRPGSREQKGTPSISDTPALPQSMRVYLLLWFSQFVSGIGTGLGSFALGVWVYRQNASATHYSMFTFVATCTTLLVVPLAGVLADRWDRKRLILFGDAGAALMTSLMALALYTDTMRLWHVYIIAVVMVGFAALQGPALVASTSMLIPRRQLARVSGMTQAAATATALVCPPLAGALVPVLDYHGVIAIDIATFLFAFIVLLFIRLPSPPKSDRVRRRSSFLADFRFGWDYLRERPGLLSLLWVFAATTFVLSIVRVLLTPLILSFGSATNLGVVNSAMAAGGLLGALLLSVWGGPQNRMNGILLFLFLQAPILLLGALQPNVMLITVASFFYTALSPIVGGLSQAIWQSKVAHEIQGRVFAMRGFLISSTAPLAFLLAGPLTDRVFEPLMAPGGALAGTVGQIIGVGKGRGVGLLFIVLGLLTMIVVVFASLNPRLRKVESEVPDAGADSEPDSRLRTA